MARRKRSILRIGGWIALGFFSLILLITLVFYLGRGWIMNRAVTYLNDQQPGEVQMGKMNLIPFLKFPNVSLQLRNVSYFEKKVHPDSLLQEPILLMSEIFVTLDVIELIRGDIQVSQAKAENGFIRIEVYEDSVTNLEYALGKRFDDTSESDSATIPPAIKVELDRIELANILLIYQDRTRDDHVNLTVNQLDSKFSYMPDLMEAGLKLDVDINHFKYLTYNSVQERNILFESEISMDPLQKLIMVEPSSLKLSDLELETWGTYAYRDEPYLDLAFRASNKGLEVLNYLFRGVLDLDEVEQIGSGSIYLSGNINGYLGDQIPVIRINGSADRIGFRIKSIEKDVTDISFRVYATNGSQPDLSEGVILVDGFTATFPEGNINGKFTASNMKLPEVEVELNGKVKLDGLEGMVKSESLNELKGDISIDGRLNGKINKQSGEFLNEAGYLMINLDDVGFQVNHDSGRQDSIAYINGSIYLRERIIGTEGLTMDVNGNHFAIGARFENLLLYLFDFDQDVKADFSVHADSVYPATLLGDSSLVDMLGEVLEGLNFNASVKVAKKELDAFVEFDSIPDFELSVEDFNVGLQVYADIMDFGASIHYYNDSILINYLKGNVGESKMDLSAKMSNFSALVGKDSGATVDVAFEISSELLRAEDFLTYKQVFMLPEEYRKEYLKDFYLSGSMQVPLAGLLDDSTSQDFGLKIEDLGWNFRNYPLTFKHFQAAGSRMGNTLRVDNFQGQIGESNVKLSATVDNFSDTVTENMVGALVLESDLLDLNELLNDQFPEELVDSTLQDTTKASDPLRLDQFHFPQFDISLKIAELRFVDYKIYNLNSQIRSTTDKIIYLDHFATSLASGGTMQFSGQLNLTSPEFYTFNTEFDLADVDINEMNFEMQSGEESYMLNENFKGLISTDGMAEIFITPDFKLDISSTTAIFNVKVKDGALINFTPLQAAAKFLDNKDLNNVKFATLQNVITHFTLVDSKIYIPMMNVESTVGQLLIEGEQSLDDSYLYLLRLPTWLVKGAARSVLSNNASGQTQDQIQEMKRGNFMRLTVWGKGGKSEVKFGDKREKYLE